MKDKKSREIFVLCLITGSIPVLISVNSSVFYIYGPFSTLNGLIVWYQRPIKEFSATGIFNNPNYLAAWLSMVMPFFIFSDYFKIIKRKNYFGYF